MGVVEEFKRMCENLNVDNTSIISVRYHAITKRLNADFWQSSSKIAHSRFVGSYGRGTAIRDFHDLDVLFHLPAAYYKRFHAYKGNGQSALLQEVRTSLRRTYHDTDIGGDGQVVVVRFTDGMRFEVVPAFTTTEKRFVFADANGGGTWRITNPLAEIAAVNSMNKVCNGNLKMLCKMTRAWRRKWDVGIGGLLIDTLAFGFLSDWKYRRKTHQYYGLMSKDFFAYLVQQPPGKEYWLAPGSKQRVYRKGVFRLKAKQCCALAEQALEYDSTECGSASTKWRQIYGSFIVAPFVKTNFRPV